MKVGAKYHVEGTGKMKQMTDASLNGKVVKSEKTEFTAAYDAEETTLAVEEKGRSSKISIKIAKLTRTERGRTEDVLPKDTVIMASKAEKKTEFEIDGQAVDRPVAQLLGLFISVAASNPEESDPTEDEIFGTKERKKVGDSWPINSKLIEESLNADGEGKAEKLVGTTKLVSVEHGASGDVAKITAEVSGKFTPPFPEEIVVDKTQLKFEFSGDFPLDSDQLRLTDTSSMTMKFFAHSDGPEGQKVIIAGSVEQSRTNKMTPMK
jgi:hypothetical protein